VYQGDELSSSRGQTVGDHVSCIWHANTEQEIITLAFLIAVDRTKNLEPCAEAVEPPGIIREESCDSVDVVWPGIASPQQDFPSKTTRADDQNPTAIAWRMALDIGLFTILHQGGLGLSHSVPVGGG
jgi:hypothetical protein